MQTIAQMQEFYFLITENIQLDLMAGLALCIPLQKNSLKLVFHLEFKFYKLSFMSINRIVPQKLVVYINKNITTAIFLYKST
ncbi:MAG: hypothetical protein ABI576_10415 [Flavobacterium sp.]